MKLSGGWYNDGFPTDFGFPTIFTWILFTVLFTKFEDEGSLALLSLLWFAFLVGLKNDSIGSDMI